MSLQKGPGAEQVRAMAGRFPIVDFSERLDRDGAFLDTAAVMKHLDLTITVDTSVAHLAGALGIPVWVAMSAIPDWRWMFQREDSPWYPSMRLFRQMRIGDWRPVFERMAAELTNLRGETRRAPRSSLKSDSTNVSGEWYALALQYHQTGDLSQAERLYRQLWRFGHAAGEKIYRTMAGGALVATSRTIPGTRPGASYHADALW